MVQLNTNGKLAFFRHSRMRSPTNEHSFIDFARELLVSKAYLKFLRMNRIYFFYIRAEYTSIWFGDNGALHFRYVVGLSDTNIQQLLKILNPPVIAFLDTFTALPDDHSSPTRFSNLLAHTTRKVSLELHGGNQDRYVDFIAQHSSRIMRLRCDSHLLLDQRIPALKPDSLEFAGPKNMEELRAIMLHQSENLTLTRYYREDGLFLDNNFLQEILTMSDIDSYPMSSSVKSLEAHIDFIDNAHLSQVIEALKKLFPCIAMFVLSIDLFEELVVEPPMVLVQRVRDYYSILKRIEEDYHDNFQRFSIDFEFDLLFEHRAYLDGIWIYELQKDDPFKSGEVDHFGVSAGDFDRWHSLTVQQNDLTSSLKFRVRTAMNFGDDADGGDQEMEVVDE